MRHEVRSIPPAPRLVRLRPLLAHRWPLLAVGGAMVVLGSLLSWAMFLQSSGWLSSERRLASEPTRRVLASVKDVDGPRHFEDRDWDFVRYSFEWRRPDTTPPSVSQVEHADGLCFVPAGTLAPGAAATAIVLEADANVSCLEGGTLHMHRAWLYPRFWLIGVVVPGAVVLMGWLAGMLQLRRVLVQGDVSVGTVLTVQTVRWVLPPMLSVVYEFRDHHAVRRHNRHWVRVNGALGQRLIHGELDPRAQDRPPTLPVLHDRRFPQWNRMLLAQDFLPSPPEPTPAEPMPPKPTPPNSKPPNSKPPDPT